MAAPGDADQGIDLSKIDVAKPSARAQGFAQASDGLVTRIDDPLPHRNRYGVARRPVVTLTRFKSDGGLDHSFGRRGHTKAVRFGRSGEVWFFRDPVLGSSGRTFVLGVLHPRSIGNNHAGFAIIAFRSNGALDKLFGVAGIYVRRFNPNREHFEVETMTVDPMDRLLLCGASTAPNSSQTSIYAVSGEGKPDLTFGLNGAARLPVSTTSACGDIAALGDGGMVVVSPDIGWDPVSDAVTRLDSSGRPDLTFAGTGTVTVPHVGTQRPYVQIAIDSFSRILVLGSTAGQVAIGGDTRVVRFNPDGQTDASFGTGGTVKLRLSATMLKVGADDALVVGGFRDQTVHWDLFQAIQRPAIAFLTSGGAFRGPAGSGIRILKRKLGVLGTELVIDGHHIFGSVQPLSRQNLPGGFVALLVD